MGRLCFYDNPWASGIIRGRQIVERLGDSAVLNSDVVQHDDTVICVKCFPPDKMASHIGRCYIDVVDCYGVIPWLRAHPSAGAIAISRLAVGYLSKELGHDNILFIREHHCNFERNRVHVTKPKVVGYVGELANFSLSVESVIELLEPLGLKFVWLNEFTSRLDVCTFYRAIDVQLTFRRDVDDYGKATGLLKNPLKLANAGSFGIPTIAFPEPTYVDEWNGCFMPANNTDAVVYWLDRLQNEPEFYAEQSKLALERAEYYHIDKVLPLYENMITGVEKLTINQAVNSGDAYCSYPFEARIGRRGTEDINADVSMQNLLDVFVVFAEHRLAMWLMFGTLLGAVRDGLIIPWDRDVDVGVFERDRDKLINAVVELKDKGFELIRTEPSVFTLMKDDEYIDFYMFKDDGDYYRCKQPGTDAIIKRSQLDEPDVVELAGRPFVVPSRSDELLNDWYGPNWREPIKGKWAF